jgi:hypothetical protein
MDPAGRILQVVKGLYTAFDLGCCGAWKFISKPTHRRPWEVRTGTISKMLAISALHLDVHIF